MSTRYEPDKPAPEERLRAASPPPIAQKEFIPGSGYPNNSKRRREQVSVTGMRLLADLEVLNELCDKVLNVEEGRDFKYRVASRIVILEVATHQSAVDAGSIWREAAFRVLVGKASKEVDQPFEPAIFSPFVFVSNAAELISGREMLGYPSLLAAIADNDESAAAPPPRQITIATSVFDGEDSELQEKEVVHIEWQGVESKPKTRAEVEVSDWLWNKNELYPRFRQRFFEEWQAQRRTGYSTLQLKQIRDAVHPQFACYQALIDAKHKISNPDISMGSELVELTINAYRSLDIPGLLGLPLEQSFFAQSYYRGSFELSLPVAANSTLSQSSQELGLQARPSCVKQRGDIQFPPPFVFAGVSIVGFKLSADLGRLQTLCDKFLNADKNQGFQYRPASSQVIMEILNYRSMRPSGPPDVWVDPRDWLRASDNVTQKELVFRILVGKVDDDRAEATDPAVFCPFILVTTPWSVVSGREVIGFPKFFAHFFSSGEGGIPEDVEDVASVSAITNWGGSESTDSAAGSSAVVTIDYVGRDASEVPVPLPELAASMMRGILPWDQEDFAPLDEFRRRFAGDWLNLRQSGFRMIQLKQVRASEHPELACYIEIVEGEYEVSNLALAFPSGSVTIGIAPDSSLKICEELGLSPGAHIVTAGNWYRAECNFSLRMLDPLA